MRVYNGKLAKPNDISRRFTNRWSSLREWLGTRGWGYAPTSDFETAIQAVTSDSQIEAYRVITDYCQHRDEFTKMSVASITEIWRDEGCIVSIQASFPQIHFDNTLYKDMRDNNDRIVRDWYLDNFADGDGVCYTDFKTTSEKARDEGYRTYGNMRERFLDFADDLDEIASFIDFGRRTCDAMRDYFLLESHKTRMKIDSAYNSGKMSKEQADRYAKISADKIAHKHSQISIALILANTVNLN